MRKVVAYLLVSVDGVAGSPGDLRLPLRRGDGSQSRRGDHARRSPSCSVAPCTTSGRATRRGPTTSRSPTSSTACRSTWRTHDAKLSDQWTNARRIEAPVDDFVRELKAGDGGPIGVHGSIALTQSLLAGGLVDELRVVIAPHVVGSGRRLFEDDVTYPLKLVEQREQPHRVAPRALHRPQQVRGGLGSLEMETRAGEIAVHYVEHGAGRPVLVLHGAGVDHREAEACFEPVFGGVAGFRRIYPDLPGMGRTVVSDAAAQRRRRPRHAARLRRRRSPTGLRTSSSVTRLAPTTRRRWPRGSRGRSLVSRWSVRCCRACATSRSTASLSGRVRSATTTSGATSWSRARRCSSGTNAMSALRPRSSTRRRSSESASDGSSPAISGPAYAGPTLVVAGRLDSTVGYAAAADLVDHYPHASLAVRR